MKSKHFLYLVLSAWFTVVGCSNNRGTEGKTDNSTDTNYSDSRRNSTVTTNTITKDSTATRDSAQHQGRQGVDQ